MMPYHAYQVAQAERPQTEATRRAADARLGEMAAALARLAATLRHPLRAVRRGPARSVPRDPCAHARPGRLRSPIDVQFNNAPLRRGRILDRGEVRRSGLRRHRSGSWPR
jgi:hypothetical protein